MNSCLIIYFHPFCILFYLFSVSRPPTRDDIKMLRDSNSPNKERLTVQWLSQSIAEIRSELAELQESSSNVSKDAQLRNQLMEDINTLRADCSTMRLELESLRSRQEKTEVLVRELREEAVQSAEDIRRSLNRQHEKVGEMELFPHIFFAVGGWKDPLGMPSVDGSFAGEEGSDYMTMTLTRIESASRSDKSNRRYQTSLW